MNKDKIAQLIGAALGIAINLIIIWIMWTRWRNGQDILSPITLFLVFRIWAKTYNLELKVEEILKKPATIVPAYKRIPKKKAE